MDIQRSSSVVMSRAVDNVNMNVCIGIPPTINVEVRENVDIRMAVAGLKIHVGHTTDNPRSGVGSIFFTFFPDMNVIVSRVIASPENRLSEMAALRRYGVITNMKYLVGAITKTGP